MMNPLAPLIFTVLVGTGATDTTVAVTAGTRLELDCFSGDIQVRAWPKDQVRVQASHTSRARVVLRRAEGRLKVDVQSRHGIPTTVDYEIMVPVWMALELGGVSTDISVEGVKGHIKASTVSGRVGVRGGSEFVAVESVEGGVQVSGARGRVEASSINDDVEILDSEGEITAETVEGNVLLSGVDARLVEISSVNGSLFFNGPLRRGGVYSLSTHQGDVIVGMSEKDDVSVTVATFDGDFSSSFPIPQLSKSGHRKRQNFMLGSGSARLDVDAFQGRIRLEGERVALKAVLDRLRAGQKAHADETTKWRSQVRWRSKHGEKTETPETPETPEPKEPKDDKNEQELEVP